MKVLRSVKPTPEQLPVIENTRPGAFVVRGAAGSGKTTTALYRLKTTVRFWQRRRRDGHIAGPVRVLVLTYNRTLRGYIEELASDRVSGNDVDLQITTFGKWAKTQIPEAELVDSTLRAVKIHMLGADLGLESDFLVSEVDYLLGRFMPDRLDEYVTCDRQGRGKQPRVPTGLRRRLLDEVIIPLQVWKAANNYLDWSDLAVEMATTGANENEGYHVAVVDEAQDFSANQVRAVLNHLQSEHTVTFVLDAAQRIYPQRFTWNEVGLTIGSHNSKQLGRNFRNTRQIAAFAAPLLKEVEITDDSAIPDFSSCEREGPKPLLVRGNFSQQMDYVIGFIEQLDPDREESVAILHAKGGGWFGTVRARLGAAGLNYVELTGRSEWPGGPTNVALSTMHSVKGLEFDHVLIVGLNSETMPHGAESGDSIRDAHLRLLAMAVGRARHSVVISYKPTEATDLIDCMDPTTFEAVDL